MMLMNSLALLVLCCGIGVEASATNQDATPKLAAAVAEEDSSSLEAIAFDVRRSEEAALLQEVEDLYRVHAVQTKVLQRLCAKVEGLAGGDERVEAPLGEADAKSVHSADQIKYHKNVGWADFRRDADRARQIIKLGEVPTVDVDRKHQIGNFVKKNIQKATEAIKSTLFVDSGSSGNHLFAFIPQKSVWATQMSDFQSKCVGGPTNMGLAALGLDRHQCLPIYRMHEPNQDEKWEPVPEGGVQAVREWHGNTTDLVWWANYRNDLLNSLFKTWKKGLGDNVCTGGLTNALAIPIVSTAGMRIISQEANNRVWENICNNGQQGAFDVPLNSPNCPDTHLKMSFASSPSCGTIPGTTEALYEYSANALYLWESPYDKVKDPNFPLLEGTFTMGGASAQISIPLIGDEDVKAFQALVDEIKRDENFNCNGMVLPGTNPPVRAPWFYSRETCEKEVRCTVCLDDYVRLMTAADVVVEFTHEEWKNALKGDNPPMKGLGLVSFLGLAGQGSSHLVSGGNNQIKVWAEMNGCDKWQKEGYKKPFDDCTLQLQEELEKDVLWSHVTKYFRKSNIGLTRFAYDTAASRPDLVLAGILKQAPDEEDKKAAWTLGEKLHEFCTNDNPSSTAFGYENGLTCMKAYWVSMYTTAFFSKPTLASSLAQVAPPKPSDLLHVPLKRRQGHFMHSLMASHRAKQAAKK